MLLVALPMVLLHPLTQAFSQQVVSLTNGDDYFPQFTKDRLRFDWLVSLINRPMVKVVLPHFGV